MHLMDKIIMSLRGNSQEQNKPYNRRLVLEAIRLQGPISRTKIADLLGLSSQSITNIVRDLVAEDLVEQTRGKAVQRGQPPIELRVNPSGAFAIGMQISQHSLKAILVDLSDQIIHEALIPLNSTSPDHILPEVTRLVDLLKNKLGEYERDRIGGLGVAMPGPFGVLTESGWGEASLPEWQRLDISDLLSKASGLPVFLGNDATVAAIGEKHYGVGQKLQNFFYIHFGSTGLGGGMVIDGNAYRGSFGNAGEFGHLPLEPQGEQCSCGNCGCLEKYVSLEALLSFLNQKWTMRVEKAELDLLFQNQPELFDDWLTSAAEKLARGICIVENLLDPQTVVVGGELPEPLFDALLRHLNPLLPSVSQHSARDSARLIKSQLGAIRTLHGSAALVMYEILSPSQGRLFTQDFLPL